MPQPVAAECDERSKSDSGGLTEQGARQFYMVDKIQLSLDRLELVRVLAGGKC